MKTRTNILIFTVLGILWNSPTQAQKTWDTEEKIYTGGIVLTAVTDIETKQVIRIEATGKNVRLEFDPFFGTLEFNWDEVDHTSRMILVPSGKTFNEMIIYYDKYNPNKDEYFMSNRLKSENKILVWAAIPATYEGKEYKVIHMFEDFD